MISVFLLFIYQGFFKEIFEQVIEGVWGTEVPQRGPGAEPA